MNYQETLLSSIIPRNQAEKEECLVNLKTILKSKITAKNFSGHYRFLFETTAIQSNRPSVLDMSLLTAYLDGTEYTEAQKTEIKILFATCSQQSVAPDKVEALSKAFLDENNYSNFSSALMTAGEILTQGKRVGKKELKGFVDAKRYFLDSISSLQGAGHEAYPADALSKSMDLFWDSYNERKNNPNSGILTGLPQIDLTSGGFRPGELVTLCAYSGEGKSQMMKNIAHNIFVRQGKNVVFATTEMSFGEVMDDFVTIHSLEPFFNNPQGIPDKEVRKGSLKPEEEERLKEVTADLKDNIQYGILYLIQMPADNTVKDLREKLMYLNNEFKIDVLCMDYGADLKAEDYHKGRTEEVSQIMRGLKDLAATFNDGQGLVVFNSHQINQASRTKVENSETKRYDFSFLADAVETLRSSDFLFWILRTDEFEKMHELKIGVSKFRGGERIPDFMVKEYYRCNKIYPMLMQEDATKKFKGVYDV